MPKITGNFGRIKAKRGFALLTPEARRKMAAKGGAAVPAENRSFSKDRDLASKAGTLGGQARHMPPSEGE